MELIVIRHGRPGSTAGDPGLGDEGRDHADRLAAFLTSVPDLVPDRVYSSPMRRARETARPLAERLGADADTVVVEDRLAEFDLGADTYVPADRHRGERAADEWRVLESGVWGEHRFDPDAFERRVLEAFATIVADNRGRRVAVVCHNGVINTYLSDLLGRRRGMFVQPEFTSFSRLLVSRDGSRRLRSINETPHLTAPLPAAPPLPAHP